MIEKNQHRVQPISPRKIDLASHNYVQQRINSRVHDKHRIRREEDTKRIRVRKTLKIDDLREFFSSDERSIFFFLFSWVSSCEKSFFFLQVPFLRPNCVLFIEHKVWPNFWGISEPFALGKRRRTASGGLANRSANNWRSIGACAALRNRGSRLIGLYATIDRRCFGLNFVVEPIDRLG